MHNPDHEYVMFIEFSVLLTFVLASIAILVVPGPSVTIIVANSLRGGVKAGFLSIAGTQAGLVILLILLALGLEALTTTLAFVFDWIRLAGAAYLIWLGYKLLRSNGDLRATDVSAQKQGTYFWNGFIVILTNPKVLFFFGAFLPQFIDPAGNAALQTLILGGIFMVLATILDGLYAIAAARTGALLTKRNVRAVEIAGGSFMVGGGLWLGLSRGS